MPALPLRKEKPKDKRERLEELYTGIGIPSESVITVFCTHMSAFPWLACDLQICRDVLDRVKSKYIPKPARAVVSDGVDFAKSLFITLEPDFSEPSTILDMSSLMFLQWMDSAKPTPPELMEPCDILIDRGRINWWLVYWSRYHLGSVNELMKHNASFFDWFFLAWRVTVHKVFKGDTSQILVIIIERCRSDIADVVFDDELVKQDSIRAAIKEENKRHNQFRERSLSLDAIERDNSLVSSKEVLEISLNDYRVTVVTRKHPQSNMDKQTSLVIALFVPREHWRFLTLFEAVQSSVCQLMIVMSWNPRLRFDFDDSYEDVLKEDLKPLLSIISKGVKVNQYHVWEGKFDNALSKSNYLPSHQAQTSSSVQKQNNSKKKHKGKRHNAARQKVPHKAVEELNQPKPMIKL